MKNTHKIAAILALFIGTLSIISGSMVLLGIETKTYTTLNWLVIYNVIFGFLSVITAYIIWKQHKFTKKAIAFILVSHLLILFYLNFFDENVASKSINAMVFRVSIWTIISLIITSLRAKK